MEHIIHQLVQDFTTAILDEAGKLATAGVGEATDRMLELCKEHAAAIATAALEEMDRTLCAEKSQRKDDGLVIHERGVPRRPMTAIGQLQFRRTYFEDRKDGGHVYLLDHIIGLESYERVCAHLSAKLVQAAGGMSFMNSSQAVTEGAVSRQTVRNKLLRTSELAYVPERKEVTPEALHIFADEDHVAMQSGKSHNVNLVTVSEGSKEVCKGRNALIDPMHIQGYRIKPERLWSYVAALCEEKYDMSEVKKVYIHGDGAGWIKCGTECFADAAHVLDAYHLNKYMKKLTAGPVCEDYRIALWKAVKDKDKAGFNSRVGDLVEEMLRLNAEGVLTKKVKSVRDAGDYILSNWDAIQLRRSPGMQGSCTEAMVSHVLSERLSRNPMGWSEDGLAQMSMLRVYVSNGGCVRESDMGSSPRCEGRQAPKYIEKYKGLVEAQEREVISKRRDWSLFEKPSFTMGLVSGTKRAYDSLAKTRYVN
jgi:hypothetical protein